MNVEQAYNNWAAQYDKNQNKTRDLEALALRETLANVPFAACLEIGCGTGKNTTWYLTKAKKVLAVDFSGEMLRQAQQKITVSHVQFHQADITRNWDFSTDLYDLVSFSLVLEHIENLDFIFREAAAAVAMDGHVYVGELHPFKQYTGSQARFATPAGEQLVPCFSHHVSDFTQAAKLHGLELVNLNEYFDNQDRSNIPRILTLLFRKI